MEVEEGAEEVPEAVDVGTETVDAGAVVDEAAPGLSVARSVSEYDRNFTMIESIDVQALGVVVVRVRANGAGSASRRPTPSLTSALTWSTMQHRGERFTSV